MNLPPPLPATLPARLLARCAIAQRAALALLGALAAGLLAAAAPPAVAAAATGPLPAEAFFRPPEVQDAVLSPSGQWLAVTTAAGAERVSLVVFDLRATEGRLPAQRLVQFREVDVASVAWVAEDRLVFTVSESDTPSGERPGSGLYAINVDGSQMRQLIARKASGPVVEPSRQLGREALSPAHTLLFVPSPGAGGGEAQVIVGQMQVDTGGNLRRVVPLWLDTRSGRSRSLGVPVPQGAQRWVFDGRGRPGAVTTLLEGRTALLWRAPGAPEEAEWQTLAQGTAIGLPLLPRFVGDDGSLLVEHVQGPGGTTVLSRFDFATGRPAPEPWVKAPGFDFQGSVLRSDVDGSIAGVQVVTDAETTVWTDAAQREMQERADAFQPGRVNRLSCRRCGQPDAVALVDSYSDRQPGALWLWRAATGRWQLLAERQPGLRGHAMAEVELHRIAARDGRSLPVWLTRPPASTGSGPRPAVVLVHGGPWLRGGSWRWEPLAQFLASRGYLVISPEFRGSRGYGLDHFRAGFRQWGRAMQDDVADALAWAQAEKLADERACIAGASYGGYATLMGLVRHPQAYRCGVAWVAVTDLMLLVEGSFWINDDTSSGSRQYALPEMIGDATADARMLRSVSPVLLAAQMQAPLLLAFGEADRRVPLVHGERMRQALREAGREPEWISYPGEGHGQWRTSTQADFARRMEAFLARHLAPGPARPPDAPR